MLKFLDGPAAGKVLCCARAPLFLRVTAQPSGEFDALDQLADRPRRDEAIYVYVKAADHGTVHYDGRDRHGKRFGRWEQCADYRLYDAQPDDATLRDKARWQAWAMAEAIRNKEGATNATPGRSDLRNVEGSPSASNNQD